MPKQMTLQEINTLDQERFVMAFGSLFEGPPWIVRQAWHARPFNSLTHLHEALCTVMYHAPVQQQVALIQAHPALVGSASLAGTSTPETTNAQASAELDRLSPAALATARRPTRAYHRPFGFPLLTCVP